MRLPLYTRKSSEDEYRQVFSCEEQRDEFVLARPNVEIVDLESEHQSAHHTGRPILNNLLDDIEAGKYDGIAAYAPDRLSRNAQDTGRIVYMVRTGIIKHLVFATFDFQNNPEGIKQLESLMSDSQYYSSNLSRLVLRGNKKHIAKGQLNGNAPSGYKNDRDPENKKMGIIVRDDEHWPMRRRMWDLMLSGLHSVAHIQRIVTEEGYRTRGTKRHPSGPISVTGLYLMYRNPRYAGLIPIPGEPGKTIKAEYPAMVTETEFKRVQSLLGRKDFREPVKREPKPFAYRGSMSCGECGAQITAEKKTRHYKNGTSQEFVYYHCTGRKRPCGQKHKNIREEDLEKQFGELLDRHTILPQFQEWALEVLDSQNEAVDTATVMGTQDRAIEAAHKEIKGLIKLAARGKLNDDQFDEAKAELEAEIAKLEKDRDETKLRAEDWYEEATRTFDLAVNGRQRFLDGDIHAKKEVLAGLGQNLQLLGGRLQFTPHPWVAKIENGYHELEADYEKVRTSNYASVEEKTAAYTRIYNNWLGR